MTSSSSSSQSESVTRWSAASASGELHRYRQRDRQRRIWTRRCIVGLSVALVMTLIFAGVRRFQTITDHRKLVDRFRVERSVVNSWSHLDNPAIERLLRQADSLQEMGVETVSQAGVSRLEQAIAILDAVEPVHDTLMKLLQKQRPIGTLLSDASWLTESSVIEDRLIELREDYLRIAELVEGGELKAAETAIEPMALLLSELQQQNAEATLTLAEREQWLQVETLVPARLRGHADASNSISLAEQADRGWRDGDWKVARSLFSQAQSRLLRFLEDELEANEWRMVHLKHSDLVSNRSSTPMTSSLPLSDQPVETGDAPSEDPQKVSDDPAIVTNRVEPVDPVPDSDITARFQKDFLALIQAEEKRIAAFLSSDPSLQTDAIEVHANKVSELQEKLLESLVRIDQVRAQRCQELLEALASEEAEYEAQEALGENDSGVVQSLRQNMRRLQTRISRLQTSKDRFDSSWITKSGQQIGFTELAEICAEVVESLQIESREKRIDELKQKGLGPGGNHYAMLLLGPERASVPLANTGSREDTAITQQVIAPFLIGKTEVTLDMMLFWLNDPDEKIAGSWIKTSGLDCPIVNTKDGYQINSESRFGKSPQQPFTQFTYEGALAYCDWCCRQDPNYDYRLPTEAEWEFAARAGATGLFPWGNEPSVKWGNFRHSVSQHSNSKSSFVGNTTQAGSYAPNRWGLCDVIGNVQEMCTTEQVDLHGPIPSMEEQRHRYGRHVACGGSWLSLGNDAQINSRQWRRVSSRDSETGLRLVAYPKSDPQIPYSTVSRYRRRVSQCRTRPNAGFYTGRLAAMGEKDAQTISVIVSEDVIARTTGNLAGPEAIARLVELWIRNRQHPLELSGYAVYRCVDELDRCIAITEESVAGFRACVFRCDEEPRSLSELVDSPKRILSSIEVDRAGDATWIDSVSAQATPGLRRRWRDLLVEHAPSCLSKSIVDAKGKLKRHPTGEVYHMSFWGVQLTPSLIQIVNWHHRSLTGIGLMRSNLSDEMLPRFKPLHRLDSLSMWGNDVSPKVLQSICVQFPQLRYFGLNATSTMTPQSAIHLSRLTKLTSLAIGWTGCDDRCLIPISRLPYLQRLVASGNEISDVGLANLSACQSLSHLECVSSKNQITRKGLNRFQAALPHCQVVMEE
ncbi:MAG: SUMF1/EgtB/PvdO family nonheme iron enzyme [Planctomycetota bacterium]